MKNAVKHISGKGYVTAILDKLDGKFTPQPPPPPLPPPPEIKAEKMARFGSLPLGFILDLGGGGWFAGHFILSKVLTLAPM